MPCDICARNCDSRTISPLCGISEPVRLASALIHFGEEPPLVNKGGSGAVFFSGCSLKCLECQNDQISHQGLGRLIETAELADVFLSLQQAGAQNLNLVTGSHSIPGIIQALKSAKNRGLSVPVFWNTGSYENPDRLRDLLPYIDGFLADLKTLSPDFAIKLCNAEDYPDICTNNLKIMSEARDIVFDKDSLISGTIVRHLVYPGHLPSTYAVLKWFSEQLQGKALLSLMAQYTPVHSEALGSFSRRINQKEWDKVLSWMDELEIEKGYVQELADEGNWFPDFTQIKPFPASECLPVWHYSCGLIK